MRIGVEEAVNEDLLEQDPRSGDGNVGRLDAQPPDALQIVDADPADELHGDHAGRGKGFDRVRNVGGGVVGKLSGAALHRSALDGEIKLALETSLEFPGQRQRFIRGQEGEPAFGEMGQVLEDVEIGLDDLLMSGRRIFRRHGAAVAENRTVNLRDRRGGHRHRVERERRPHRAAGR